MSKQVMEQAIEAMLIKQRVTMWENDGDADKFNAAIAALKEAIKQAGEPVAWATFDGEGGYDLRLCEGNEDHRNEYIKRNGEKYAGWVIPLYAAPAIPEGWQPMINFLLGEDMLDGLWFGEVSRTEPTKPYWWREELRRLASAAHIE